MNRTRCRFESILDVITIGSLASNRFKCSIQCLTCNSMF